MNLRISKQPSAKITPNFHFKRTPIPTNTSAYTKEISEGWSGVIHNICRKANFQEEVRPQVVGFKLATDNAF